jgi:hypothetical protein
MSPAALRVWFLCTLLLAGMIPVPAAVAGNGGGCCGQAMRTAGAALAEPHAAASSEALPPTCCCAPEATPHVAHEAPADEPCPSGEDDCACGDSCRCPRCGSAPGGVTPAVRPRAVAVFLRAAERAIVVPTRTCVAREAGGGLLRPPQV